MDKNLTFSVCNKPYYRTTDYNICPIDRNVYISSSSISVGFNLSEDPLSLPFYYMVMGLLIYAGWRFPLNSPIK